jgi:hypothetical protein
MSEAWQAGDLALCISDSPNMFGEPAPVKKGRIYRVTGTMISEPGFMDSGLLGLYLEGVRVPSSSGAIAAIMFRKIKPDTEGAKDETAAWWKKRVDA